MTTMIGRGPIPPGHPMPAKNPPTLGPSCVCADPQVDRLRELVAGGMDQREASRQLWPPTERSDLGPEPVDPAPWATLVRAALTTALPWLNVPAASEVS